MIADQNTWPAFKVECEAWLAGDLRIERAEGSVFHQLVEAWCVSCLDRPTALGRYDGVFHWFDSHLEFVKTWIRWMLVGDPDLGFIDKHYRV